MQDPVRSKPDELTTALPGGLMLTVVLSSAALIGSGWMLVGILASWTRGVTLAGPAGAAAVGITAAAGILVMTPWKSRTISWWMTFWLAGMLVRVALTAAATFVLYFTTPLNAQALALAVGFTYLVVLLAEAAVLARFVSRVDALHRSGDGTRRSGSDTPPG